MDSHNFVKICLYIYEIETSIKFFHSAHYNSPQTLLIERVKWHIFPSSQEGEPIRVQSLNQVVDMMARMQTNRDDVSW